MYCLKIDTFKTVITQVVTLRSLHSEIDRSSFLEEHSMVKKVKALWPSPSSSVKCCSAGIWYSYLNFSPCTKENLSGLLCSSACSHALWTSFSAIPTTPLAVLLVPMWMSNKGQLFYPVMVTCDWGLLYHNSSQQRNMLYFSVLQNKCKG